MDAACLVDLGFDGNPFTWTNIREGAALIRERLDRALAKHTWISKFQGTEVSHLPRSYSVTALLVLILIFHLLTLTNFILFAAKRLG